MMDYDGTLTPLAAHPNLAIIRRDTRHTLAQLAELPRVMVGIISGRSIENIKAVVDLPNLCYAGTSGLEFDVRGSQMRHPQADRVMIALENLAETLAELVPWYPGAWLERKPLGLTVHFRHLHPLFVVPFVDRIRDITEHAAFDFKTMIVSKAVEITPNLGWNKGTALEQLMDHSAANAFPFFAGDSSNDVAAFESARRRGGVTLAVGPEYPCESEFRMDSPDDLVCVLRCLLDSISPRRLTV